MSAMCTANVFQIKMWASLLPQVIGLLDVFTSTASYQGFQDL